MVRKLLPCPVCGGESFIESVTQGGLICSDCGAVSNQVEVADDEDDVTMRPAFVRPVTYTHVTEEESQAKRDRRVLIKLRDNRTTIDILDGLQQILNHMIKSLVNKDLCSRLAMATTRDAWFTFLTRMSLLDPVPRLLEGRWHRSKMVYIFQKWGIPARAGQIEIVTSTLPPERRKQWSTLLLMMEERNLSVSEIVVVEDAPEYIYAHDWLCMFFNVNTFPFPDYLFLKFLAPDTPCPLKDYSTLADLIAASKELPTTNTIMSPAERRWAVRELFYKILRNEKIRIDFFRDKELPISSPIPTDQPLPRIDIQTLLAIVIIGIRNSNGGVLPIHVLNWIARGDLPFFTAHKHLEAPLERIEYYASTAAQGAYTQPAFSPISAPGIDELENLVETIIKTVGVPTKPCDPINLLKTSMNMLGLPSGVLEFGEQLLSATWFGMMVGGRVLFVANSNRRMGLRIHDSRTKRRSPYNVNVEDIIVADVSVYEYVAVHIIFIMKLLFPDLHLEHPPDDTNCEEIGKSKKFPGFYNLHASINGPIHYQIQSNRGHQFSGYPVKFGTIEFWDSMTIDEQEQLLSFIDNERLPELRECIVDKNVRDTIRNKSVESTVAADQEHPSVNKHNRITLISGPLSQYQMTDELLNLNGTLSFLIRDVMRACGCKDIVRISLILRDFEKRIFASKFKFTRGSRESRAPVSHNN